MKRVIIPSPPNPEDALYRSNPLAHSRAMFDWANAVKGKIESASLVNDAPAAQTILATNFTTNTVATGTTTGTDLSNVVCSLIAALTAKGILKSH